MATIGELFIKLGFDVDDKKLKSFDDGIKSVRNEMAKLAAGAAVAVYAVNRFVNDSVNDAIKLQKFRTETGYATEDLERFYNVARSLDQTVTLDDVIGAFRQLSDVISSAQWGELPGGALFLGIPDIRSASPAEIINKVRANRDKVLYGIAQGDVGKFRQLVEEVGLGDVFAAIMADEQTYDDLFKSAIPTTKEQQEAILQLARAYSDFNYEFATFKREMTTEIAPYIIPIIQQAIPLLREFVLNISAVGNALNETFGGDATQYGIIAFLALLATRLSPVAVAITAIVAGLNEIGAFFRNKDSFFDSTIFGDVKDGFMSLKGLMNKEEFFKQLQDPESSTHEWFMKSFGGGDLVEESMIRTDDSISSPDQTTTIINNSPTFNVQSSESSDDLWSSLNNMNSRNNQSTMFDMGTDFEGAIVNGNY
jgi:hypothetical protein